MPGEHLVGSVDPATQKCPTGQMPPIPVCVPVGVDISTPEKQIGI